MNSDPSHRPILTPFPFPWSWQHAATQKQMEFENIPQPASFFSVHAIMKSVFAVLANS